MTKLIVPKRFSKNNLSNETAKRFMNFVGPIQNFFGTQTIMFLNLRMFIDENGKRFRIVNEYNQKIQYKVKDYIKDFLIIHTDGIFTTVISFFIYSPRTLS
jgi:hypothetical protein